jgi:hypothetical protein
VANTGFTYLRGKNFIQEVIKAWEITGKSLNDEIAFSYAVDELDGGWKGPLYYCQQHEPMFCRMKGRGPCPDEIFNLKNPCFVHYFRK